MEVRLESSWKELLKDEFEKSYFKDLAEFVRQEYQSGTVYPPPKFIFNALDSLPVDQVKVIILGQDPYHGPGQAHGLSFSVPDGIKPPPSLQNIYKEIETDLGHPHHASGNLDRWVKQGVLLLNATLTVRANQAGSHQNKGWETFTDAIIHELANKKDHLVFILWGNYAQKKGSFIDPNKHLVLKSPHPSPFSAHSGFFDSRPFSQTNRYLIELGQTPIEW
ncbi:TPA: uracil-DNA glycosylase [Candidatus Collierbacteria bacterium]|uniref:Uracil-DNA glycosylase n=1 Tax=Candidatus Collierbacteria bacterium GW2011_GWB2_44_22 TaxID=1618387 RepID=A0A0G1HX15_9BACT|nr:MAG: Uracil-DNA glycosylase [Candidatus Collierbacteria bacterium GW2011_GWA2_44_13]KKT51178.1 MAG: Uracil-DNA glycosylase [Candidatus Collierbacteria bacterium GW2011_GWB2_44_22]KKT61267.1 MAG: Uracil-DNA glycosylase [Candidatus Collierbacteria bacterium GW2011_GWD1_44_27]KKT65985.1 MAG: Uracil-DNA glycosylase [Candidatus Collierbacteria bacterium GW2011_GWC2_44_30]KKT68256.1 MAG: ung, uracil-DNA glycosylase, uracil-DNA glycosylase [Microgenomates group bacterium GW2011_GWC1_44_37]KKT88142